MGNIASEEGSRKALKRGSLSHTALGRYTTPLDKTHSSKTVYRRSNDKTPENPKNDLNAKIYKEIFPPPSRLSRVRNTISPIAPNSLQSSRLFQTPQKNIRDSEVTSLDDPRFTLAEDSISQRTSSNLLDSGLESNQVSSYRLDLLQMGSTTYNEENSKNIEIRLSPIQEVETDDNIYSEEPQSIQKTVSGDYELNYFRRGDDIRRSYIAKLIHKQIWQPTKKEKNHNTLIIFDWDDTLLCTSFLTPNGVFSDDVLISEKDIAKIRKLASSSHNILQKAINMGDTYIITNAAPGWVEYSAKRFFPELYKLLPKVTIVSARGEYEKIHPGDSRQWKILAFLEMLKSFDTALVTNLICLGDSIIEMEAAHILASKFNHAFIKTIKFREAPKPDELIKQLNLVSDQFDGIFSAIKNLTIRVEKKAKDKEKQWLDSIPNYGSNLLNSK